MTGLRTSLMSRHCSELARVDSAGNLPISLGNGQAILPPLAVPVKLARLQDLPTEGRQKEIRAKKGKVRLKKH